MSSKSRMTWWSQKSMLSKNTTSKPKRSRTNITQLTKGVWNALKKMDFTAFDKRLLNLSLVCSDRQWDRLIGELERRINELPEQENQHES